MLGISATGREGRKFFDQLVHCSWDKPTAADVYQAPPCHYLGGEPIFLPDPNDEAAGAVICQIFDAQHVTSAFALFDAFHVAKGPLALLHQKWPVPLGFHASFRAA
jgi:carotenoid cleavage dioxygenase